MGTQNDPPPRDGDTSRTSVRSKVAELLALRDSISESAVSLDKFANEDAVREHVLRPALSSSQMVLRPSASVPAFSKPLKSSSALGGSNTALNQTRNASEVAIMSSMSSMSSRSGNQKKPSPSPSIKRNKVERLIKEHGSPPGIRVTAGGRIVPSDLRLGSPSFPIDDGPANGFSRGSGRIDRAPFDMGRSSSSLHSMNSMHVNHPAASVGYTPYGFQPSAALLQYYGYPGTVPYAWTPTQPRAHAAAPEVPQTHPASLTDLKKALEKILHEQRELEREMVIQENAISAEERTQMVADKIRMITEADRIRKEIKRLEGDDKNAPTSASSSESSLSDSKKQPKPTGVQKPSEFVNPSAGIAVSQHNPFLYSTPPPHGYMYPHPQPSVLPQFMGMAPGFAAYPNPNQGFNGPDANAFTSTDSLPNPEVNKTANGHNKPPQKASGHTARKSHALEIKDPRSLPDLGKNRRSALDPTSPAYTPQKQDRFDDRNGESSPTTSPQRATQLASNLPWLSDKKTDGPSPMRSATSSAHRPSASSINTADFFPHNPHEHSSGSYVNRKTEPVTPEKSRWNHGQWNSDFLSPDPVQALKAPQVSPVNGVTADMNALTLHRGPEALTENGRLHAPRNVSKEHSDKASIYTRRSSRKHLKESKTPAVSTSGTLDYSNKSTGFLMGFSAGLTGQAVMGTEDLEFMQGWAQGLVQAKRARSQDGSNTEASDSSVEEDDFQSPTRSPVALQHKAETSSRQVSTATIKPAPGPIQRPVPGVFDSFTSDRSIISDMGLNPPTPNKLKAMSGQSAAADAAIRENIDTILNNTPIKKISGNEAEPQKGDKSEHSPSKLTRVFSGSQHSQQKGQRFSLNCLGDQRSQNRNMRLSYDGQYDDDMAELEGAFPTPQSPKGESATRGTPSKFFTGPSETAGTPNAGSPKRSKLSPSKDKPKNLKPEMEDPSTMNPAAKKNWKEGWRKKFSHIKANEEEEVANYRAQNPLNG
ncbi:hypothetical protein HDK77DRAFT_480777 [Phyllosticta capitalensis]|uniref:Uncharacterized protein n=1 Tax=Phyllosticta capitalensis TaxID=121624 RepID=A0ABR1YWE3_9PEZI